MKIYNKFECKVYIYTKKEGGRHSGFGNNYKPQFFFRTMNITGKIKLPEDIDMVLPGDDINMSVETMAKVPLNIGLRFVMREGNLTIGGGVITKL